MPKAPSSLTSKKKSEIIEAYEELLTKLQQQSEAPSPEKQRKSIEQESAVKKANSLSNDAIVRSCAELKLQLGKQLDELEGRFSDEYRKFTEVQKAIEAESARLEEIHQITANADSLAALLAAQRERKSQFEESMADEKRSLQESIAQHEAQWRKEKELYLRQQEEEKRASLQVREREEEEYEYEKTLSRKRDEDAYREKRMALEAELVEKRQAAEKELVDREAFIASQEGELERLKQESATFPERLDAAIIEAKERIAEQLQREHSFERELARKSEEGERRLLEQTIAGLRAKISEQEGLIEQLTRKADLSSQQVQEIAVRAIDSARPLGQPSDRAVANAGGEGR